MSKLESFSHMKPGLDLDQAMAEAERCLLCHDAPCSTGCPADTDPGTFIRKLRLKNITGAIRTIKTNNILGGACGVLCPTARLCEEHCSATAIDRPIQIGDIQRSLIEHSWLSDQKYFSKPKPRTEKVAVVGSGPAGLSCAADLAKEGFQVTIFEARPEPGGVLRYGVVAYRFDLKFLENELRDIRELGVEFKCNSPISEQRDAEKLLQEGYQAVFLGPGLWDAAQLQSSSTAIEGLYSSVNYLASLRQDTLPAMAQKLADKTVAVIGGGSVAMDCVESAAKLGARDVYLVYRRSYAQMPAEPDERLEALEAGIHFLLLNQPLEYVADDGNRLTGLKLARTRLGNIDDSGRRRPEPIPGSEWILDADIAVEAIGNKAPDDSPSWYPNVKLSGRNLVEADEETGQTSVAGIFAGGDIVRGPALVVSAVADGKKAACAIGNYLNQKE